MSLSANHVQADDCVKLSELSVRSCVPAGGGWLRDCRSRADVARRVGARGPALLEPGVSLPARRAARPLHLFGDLSDGRSRTIYVPAAVAAVVEQHVEVTQHNEALLAEISLINLELLRRRALG